MTTTVLTLLVRAPGLDAAAFDRHWAGAHAELVTQLPGIRSYVQSPPHPDVARRQTFDGMAAVQFDDLDALDTATRSPAYAKIQTDESSFADPDHLVTVVVDRREVDIPTPTQARPGAVKFVGCMHRRSDCTGEEFLHYWRRRHASLAATLPSLQRYVHHVPIRLRGTAPYDGIAELWFPSSDALRSAFRSDTGVAVRADEQEFVDPKRSFALRLSERRIL